MDQAIKIRAKCQWFRVLVIGRSNAGKTTILKKVCNSTDDPMIFDPSGNQIDPAVITASAERGEHNIENEMIFKSNPQFIFHDSRGFECGSVDETKIVQAFIKKRAESRDMMKQLHAIWYCLPTDTDRPILAADEMFFQQCGTGNVPVIAIFTKFDGLITTAYGQLRSTSDISVKEARRQAPDLAKKKLDLNFIAPLINTNFPPKKHLYLQGMQKESTNCSELVERTAEAIDDDALKLLFVSVQQNNMDLCIFYAVHRVLRMLREESIKELDAKIINKLVERTLAWFPHTWMNFEYDDGLEGLERGFRGGFRIFQDNVKAAVEYLILKLDLLKGSLGPVFLFVAIIICTEQIFFQLGPSMPQFPVAFSAAFDRFVATGMIYVVQKKINTTWDSLTVALSQRDSQKTLVGIIKESCLRV